MILDPVVLEGAGVRLEPLSPGLREEMKAALNVDPEAWSILVTSGHGAAFDGWWDEATAGLETGTRMPYAVRHQGRIAGATGYLEISRKHRRVEIGGTFYRPEARGGMVNPACKRLLLAHAFDQGAIRCEFVTDAINVRSRAALARLGAVEEGVLRRHKVTHTGRIRDTVMFAVTDEDWPGVRMALDRRLARDPFRQVNV